MQGDDREVCGVSAGECSGRWPSRDRAQPGKEEGTLRKSRERKGDIRL